MDTWHAFREACQLPIQLVQARTKLSRCEQLASEAMAELVAQQDIVFDLQGRYDEARQKASKALAKRPRPEVAAGLQEAETALANAQAACQAAPPEVTALVGAV